MKINKKVFIKRLTLIFAFILVFVVISLYLQADTAIKYNANEWETFKNRTKDEIGRKYSYALGYDTTYRDGDKSTYYTTISSTENPYEPGVLSNDTIEVMTRMTNYYRWLVGANDLEKTSPQSEDLQAGALVRNFDFAHRVNDAKRPSDMSEELWNQGAHCGHNIIASGYTPRSAIIGWVNEGVSYSGQLEENGIGHRTAIIGSKYKNLQFGYSGRVAIGFVDGSNGYYSKELAYYAFPVPRYMPIQSIDSSRASWSIELNSKKIKYDDINQVRIVVTNTKTNEHYECTSANGKIFVDSFDKHLTYTPPTLEYSTSYSNGDKYKVEVYGLKDVETGSDAEVVYETEFFDLNDYATTKVTSVRLDGFISVNLDGVTDKKLEYISYVLPKEATIYTESGKKVNVPLTNEWKLDKTHNCWTNHVDESLLPSNVKDIDSVLKNTELKVEYNDNSINKWSTLKTNKTTVVEGDEGVLELHRYYTGGKKFALYQFVDTDDGGYTAKKIYDQDDGLEDDGTNVKFPMKYTIEDTGTYYAMYYDYSSISLYLTNALDITVNEKQVQSISVVPPTKNTYKIGENIDISNGKVNITYDNNSTNVIELTEDMISGFSSDSKGISTVTVKYKDKTTSFDCLIVGNPDNVEAKYGDMLKDVKLPDDPNGVYTWKDGNTLVGDVGEHTFDVIYTPTNDIYSKVEDLTGVVKVNKAIPEYDENITLEATYGNTLKDVKLPTRDNGTYQFEQSSDKLVGNAGVNKTEFTLKFIPSDSTNYEVVTQIPVTLNIAKAIPEFDIPSDLEAGYGDKLEDVTLPDGFTWNNAGSLVGSVGKNTFKATYTPKDPDNYETVTDVDVEINVGKATPKFDMPTGLTATYGDTLSKVNLPQADNGSYSWNLDGNTLVGNVGENTFDVTFTPNDENYRSVVIKVTITVNKANPSYTVPTGLTATYGDTLADVELQADANGVYEWQDDESTSVGTAGEHNFKVKYVPNDSDNYNVIYDIETTIKVNKANPSFEIPSNLVVECGKKLSDVELPKEFSWENGEQEVGNVGTKSFRAIYTPADTDNYNTVVVDIPVEVIKTKPTFDVPTDITAVYGDTLANITLPETANGKFVFEDDLTTSVGDAGTKVFLVKFVPNDTANYSIVEHIQLSIKVNKAKAAEIVVPTVSDITYDPNKHLSDITLPDNWSFEDPNIVPTVDVKEYKAVYTPTDANNYDYSGQNLEPMISINVLQAVPTFDPPVLVGFKDETLADIELPTLSNGKFVWQEDTTTKLEHVGTQKFKVKFVPNDDVNYKTVTDIEVTINVNKAKPEYTVPENLTATYGDLLSSVKLPEGFTWSTPDVVVGDAGTNVFLATFTPTDTENYSIVNNIEIKVLVKKKLADPIKLPTFEEMVYDPNRHLSDIILPERWTWEDENIVPSVANNGYTAIYTPEDTKNYDYSKQNLTPKLKLNIKKADPYYTIPENLTAEWGQNLSDIVLPAGFSWQTDENVGEIGVSKFNVVYTPEDTNNYNVIRNIEVEVKVVKATAKVTPPDDVYVNSSEGLTLKDIELPDGWSWVNPDEQVTSSGKHQVMYIPEDQEHYNSVVTEISVNVTSTENPNPEEGKQNDDSNPNTGDNLRKYVILLISSMLIIGFSSYKLKKRFNR